MKNLVVVYNPKSGGALTKLKLERRFRAAGLSPTRFIPVNKKLSRRLSISIRSNAIIAVVGGDGTMSYVADMIAGTGATLAPLPGGTLNHFARDLHIPDDIDEALQRLASARRHKIDTASVNNVGFINNSSIGLYPSSLHARKHLEDRLGKWPAAIIGSFRALFRFRAYRLKVNGELLSSPFVFVGNGLYHLDDYGNTDRSRLTSGALSVYVAKATSRWQLFIIFVHALTGRLHAARDFDAYIVRDELVIESLKRNIKVSHDGEVERLSGRLTYRIHRKSLWVR